MGMITEKYLNMETFPVRGLCSPMFDFLLLSGALIDFLGKNMRKIS
jgi:hypothetical protein